MLEQLSYMFHIYAFLILVFITLQLVHQFTSIAKTVYYYTVKTITELHLYMYNLSSDMFRFFTNHPQEAS